MGYYITYFAPRKGEKLSGLPRALCSRPPFL